MGDLAPQSIPDGDPYRPVFVQTSPELIASSTSPDIPKRNSSGALELSFENGIQGCIVEDEKREIDADSSFELIPQLDTTQELKKDNGPAVYINVGSSSENTTWDGISFMEDSGFTGGKVFRHDAFTENGLELYHTARVGDFSYTLQVQPGVYDICLHLAEIEFLEGPVGVRIFDVYIQHEKVVAGLDIFARVGAHRPLVISDLKATVQGEEELSIGFEGLTGSPILSGLSIIKESDNENQEALAPIVAEVFEQGSTEKKKKRVRWEDEAGCMSQDYDQLMQELTATKRAFEELKRENNVKSRECQEALSSMRDLQNELMRKSIHVGSLAFAIEGQVKEKSKWFSSLSEMTRRLRMIKMEHAKLAKEASEYAKFQVDLNSLKLTIEEAMNQRVDLNEDLRIKYIRGTKELRELYNKVLELKGNIRVFCRCRPLNADEMASSASAAISLDSAKDRELTVTSNGIPKKTFKFDAVFGPQSSQADVFEETAPFATSVLDGYNVCIFAYGQTGSGKTFTMEGLERERGVNFRTLEELFHTKKERQNQFRYEVTVSVLEIYNEQIRDLLAPTSHHGASEKRLEVRQLSDGLHYIPGLVEANVSSVKEAWEVLRTGSTNRAVGSTSANDYSSRSHCMHCITVRGENLLSGECTRSKLWLVDLAGSERITKTEAQGERLKEAQNINRSLSALGDVIAALASKSPHIPFRNSKLTHLLQDSLGGDSKTLMFVHVSPNENDLGETLCSLNFASRARGIELGPPRRQLDTIELMKYRKLAEKSKQDLSMKDNQIKRMDESIQALDMKIKEKDLKNKNLQDKIKELESQLLVERKLARQHVDTRIAEQHLKQQKFENSAPPKSQAYQKMQVGSNKNPTENSHSDQAPSSLDNAFEPSEFIEKENNPPEFFQLPKRPEIKYVTEQIGPVTRRNSLIPLPILALPPQPVQLHANEDAEQGSSLFCLPAQFQSDSPKEIRLVAKKLGSVLRRSLQKRQQKSPLQQNLKQGRINVGMERLRVSVGSRGRLLGGGRRTGTKDTQKRSKKEKERGWNFGTSITHH